MIADVWCGDASLLLYGGVDCNFMLFEASLLVLLLVLACKREFTSQ